MDRDFDETVVVCIKPMKGFHSPQLVDAAPVKGGDDHYSLCNLRPFLLYLLTVMMISLFECCVVLGPFRLIMSPPAGYKENNEQAGCRDLAYSL